MGGRAKIKYRYFADLGSGAGHNTAATYAEIFRQLDGGVFDYYNGEGQAFFDALKKYPLRDKSVLIWGLAGCNCEALAVWAGAAKVLVVDYNKPVCDHEKITVFNHDELQAAKIKTDCAISYSSFEHDGLGRYGDPIAPDGDLRAMRQAWETLNDDGILFFGVGLGRDCVKFNSHRIYGAARLPLMLRGWRLLDVFSIYKDKTPDFPFDLRMGKMRQCVMVLRKIAADYPDEKELNAVAATGGATSAPALCRRINQIVSAHCRRREK
ncbi:hypothetical protein FACS1894139_12600 [Planctomycetales bacterium]|nr:hypothetical protein FACS1894108_07510 [Planctomycetales bacterium]GHT06535.1 hypothetical protein FACS1894139_12600 [Planctomycetales bacterium]